jgi:hypothetical protein
MANIERWKLMADWVMPAQGGSPQPLTVVIGPPIPPGEKVEVVPASQLAGAVEALREAIEAARLFNRSGMTWREYDALLARLEHDHLGGQ